MISCDKCGFGHRTFEELAACKSWSEIQKELQSGAPVSPALPQSNSGEGSHATERCPERSVVQRWQCSQAVGHEGLCTYVSGPSGPLYTQAELNTLLDQMARSVVEEAAKIAEDEWKLDRRSEGHPQFFAKYKTVDVDEAIRAMLTPEKLTQLREAVQRI